MDNDTKIRMIITVVLCTALFFVWQLFYMPKTQNMQGAVDDKPAETQPDSAIQAENAEIVAVPLETPVLDIPSAYSPPFTVEMSDFSVNFDAMCGDIHSVTLHTYTGKANEAVTFARIDSETANYATLTAGIASGYTHTIDKQPGKTIVTFKAENEILRVTKQYALPDKGYYIPVEFYFENLSEDILSANVTAAVGPEMGKGFESELYVYSGPIIHNKEKTEKKKAKDVKKTLTLTDPLWGGYTSKYFIFAIFAEGFDYAEISKSGNSAVTVFSGNIKIAPGMSESVKNLAFYVGPKEYETLKAFGIELQKSIDYGWFFFLAIPMKKIMNFIYDFVHNYGLAIIILTVIVKIITLPLTLKSMISMRAMAKLQPEMVKIKEQYKDEPQKMNAATMELYKKNNINPMSGCLPVFVQIPVFFALYKTLLVSIELKGAPFFGWIIDLSAKDPYYITPILMGITMFLQQKMTPSTMDPMQQKIFLVMPVVFAFMCLNFPSGLVVYWLTNNVLSIAQQYVINKRVK
ncbi:MAG: membrane protein insertase YidC [Deferribacteraceae bacterium]|jgi:YidC/Oxa1 family membrane protein insertase|nr:membrane protein insertase YidC [Deferribacteraceae bacterium]